MLVGSAVGVAEGGVGAGEGVCFGEEVPVGGGVPVGVRVGACVEVGLTLGIRVNETAVAVDGGSAVDVALGDSTSGS